MKRLATLFILTILVATAGFAKPKKYKDLSGNIAVKGELTKEYRQSPAGRLPVHRSLSAGLSK